MGLFKLRPNKKFTYTPRYWDDKGEGSPFKFKHKFDEHRKTVQKTGLKGKFENAIDDLKSEPDEAVNRRLLIIIVILLLAFLFIIDFDLSIFFRSN
jgi:hypothetical protein